MANLRRLIRQKAEDNKELDAEVEELTVNVAERHNVEEAQGLSDQINVPFTYVFTVT